MKALLNKFLTIKIFLFFSVLIFLLKIVYSWYSGFSELYFEDWSIAQNIVKCGEYSEFINIGPTAYKLPVYPLFMSFFMYLFPNHYFEVIVLMQHVLYFLVPLLIIKILDIFNKRKAGIIAAYIFIFSPAYFHYSMFMKLQMFLYPYFCCGFMFF